MKTQQLHQVLNAVWAVVADANRYFAGEAPWALAKTDPAKQGTVLYVTAEVIAAGRHPGAAVRAGVGGKAARSAGRAGRTSAIFAAWAAGIASRPAPRCRRPRRCSRVMSSRGKRRDAMLVDSHCHLDFPDFASELDAVVARARAAGIGRMVTISTRVTRHARCWRSPNVSRRLLLGRHASAPRARRTRHRRGRSRCTRAQHPKVVAIGEAGLDYHYDNSPRDAQEKGFRAHIAAARATGLPLVDPFARCRRRHGAHSGGGKREGRLPGRAALLHRRAATWPCGAVALGHYVSFTGILTFKNSGRSARDRRRRCRPTASWSKPTRLISRPARIAASATSRLIVVETAKVLARDARRFARRDRAADHRELLPAVRKGAAHALS